MAGEAAEGNDEEGAGAGSLAGGATGAVIGGAIGGPPGAIVGGAVGAAGGAGVGDKVQEDVHVVDPLDRTYPVRESKCTRARGPARAAGPAAASGAAWLVTHGKGRAASCPRLGTLPARPPRHARSTHVAA